MAESLVAEPPGAGSGPQSVAARRAAIDDRSRRLRLALASTIRPGRALAAEAAGLSAAYRSAGAQDNRRGHVHDDASAGAYAAARMPATFAACARAMSEAADRLPDFRPSDVLDVGAGTGAAAWAASAVWPSLRTAILVDREPAAVALGRRLAAAADADGPLSGAEWRIGAAGAGLPRADLPRSDLVLATYLLGELDAATLEPVVASLWAATAGALVLVEPGSRAGFERVRAARSALIAAGGRVAAPCPGDEPCPLAGTVWCHFLARLDRSPLQRAAKGAVRSWEDEPFSYVAVTRATADPAPRVVLGRPRQRPGIVELRICRAGRIETRTTSRREGAAWRAARDLRWGDPVPDVVLRGVAPGAAAGRGDARSAAHRNS